MPTKFNDFVRGFYDNGVRQLTPEELIYQCLLHASVHSYVKKPGIKLYFDIGVLAEKYNIDWDCVMSYAERDGYAYRVSIASYFSVKYVNANIPESFYLSYINKLKHKKTIMDLLNIENNLFVKISAYSTLKIEAYCDNVSILTSIFRMLFPDKTWIKSKYVNKNILRGYIKHILNIIKGLF